LRLSQIECRMRLPALYHVRFRACWQIGIVEYPI
jgi:hypothetical protein